MRREIIGETLLHQFRVENYIASGGMATIYRVWDIQRNVPLAMKVLHPELADDPAFISRFQREAQSLQMLVHPHIVPFYGLYQDQGLTFLLERYIDGPSLDEVLRRQNGRPQPQPLPLLDALVIFKAMYTSLGYAHAQGIIHCDVKPGNVLIDQGGHVYLTDFGIARYMDSSMTTSSAMGTPLYMAPEQIRGERLTPQADIYSLGVLLFELLTGQRPFMGDIEAPPEFGNTQSDRVRYQHLYAPPPDPRGFNSAIPEGLARVVQRAMAKNPADRYPTVMEMAEEISRAIGARFDTLPNRVRLAGEFGITRQGEAEEGGGAQAEPAAGPWARPQAGPPQDRVSEPYAGTPGDTLPGRPPLAQEAQPAVYSGAADRRAPVQRPVRPLPRRWLALLAAILLLSLCALLGTRIVNGLRASVGGLPPAPSSTPSDPTAAGQPGEQASPTAPDATQAATSAPTAAGLSDFSVPGEIAIVQRDAADQLYLLDAAAGSANALPILPGADVRLSQAPQWSPDGQRLTWMSQVGDRLHVVVMNLNDQIPNLLSAGEAYPRVSSPSWLPDSQRVSFWASSGGQNWLVIADSGTGEELDRVALPGYRNLFVWNWQNSRTAFAQQTNGQYEVVSSALANTADTVIESGGEEYAPAWSNDGNWLAFQSDAGRAAGENDIWISQADGSSMHTVAVSPPGTWSRAPTWSPDGKMIAFVSNRSGGVTGDHGELFVVNLDTGEVKQLTNTGGRVYDWRPAWRP